MIEINLLPLKILNKRRKRDFIIFVGICGVVAIVICYILYLSLYQSIYPLKERLGEIKKEIARYQPLLRQIEDVKKENSEIEAYFNAFREVVAKQSFWPRMLYEVYKALPESIWLEEIKSNLKEGFIEIQGKSLSQTIGVAEFMNNMRNSGFFSKIDFTKFSQQEVAGKQVMIFKIKCFLSEKI